MECSLINDTSLTQASPFDGWNQLYFVSRFILFNFLFLLIYVGLGFWGWGFHLMGFGVCGVGPSGFFGLGLYKHKRITLGKNGACNQLKLHGP